MTEYDPIVYQALCEWRELVERKSASVEHRHIKIDHELAARVNMIIGLISEPVTNPVNFYDVERALKLFRQIDTKEKPVEARGKPDPTGFISS